MNKKEIFKAVEDLRLNNKEMLEAIEARRGAHDAKFVKAITEMLDLEGVVMAMIDHPLMKAVIKAKFADVSAYWMDAVTVYRGGNFEDLKTYVTSLAPDIQAVLRKDVEDSNAIGDMIERKRGE